MNNELGARAPHQPRRDSTAGHNAALLIDFDNVTMGIRSDLQAQLRKLFDTDLIKGKVAVQRAYADWRRYPQYIVPLSEASIDLIFAPAFGSNKKNATDIRLAIDALELVFTRPEIGTFILLSGDSDFSALVLKLKEYGKYVVGVGIRESASDLLMQNCDEYYSYSELTGLSKEAEPESLPRDPWETVVQAIVRMKSSNDVMRSDRLKQVMQEIDPHFDEKDAGFNKFSKFVVEASRRGLLVTAKMENGQYEVELGSEANVPPAPSAPVVESPPAEPKPRRKRTRSPVAEVAGAAGMTLAQAFSLLRRALTDLGAVGDEATDVDRVKDRVSELAEDENDPVFESKRFQRLLRQAHDASVIELVKTDEDVYRLKLGAHEATDAEVPTAEPGEATAAAVADDVPEEAEATKKKVAKKTTRTKRKRTATKATGSRSKKATSKESEVEPPAETPPPEEDLEAKPVTAPAGEKEGPKRGGRFRTGSRRGTSKARTADADETDAKAPVVEDVAAEPPVSKPKEPVRASLRGRKGSRGRKAPAADDVAGAEDTVPPPAEDATPTPEPSASGETSKQGDDAPVQGASLRGRRSSRTRRAAPSESREEKPPLGETAEAEMEPSPPSAAAESDRGEEPAVSEELAPSRGEAVVAGASSESQSELEQRQSSPSARSKTAETTPADAKDATASARMREAKPEPGSDETGLEEGSLFKRMAVAFQRAVLGQEEESQNAEKSED